MGGATINNSSYTYHLFSRHDFSTFWALFTDNLINLIMRPIVRKKVENEISGKGNSPFTRSNLYSHFRHPKADIQTLTKTVLEGPVDDGFLNRRDFLIIFSSLLVQEFPHGIGNEFPVFFQSKVARIQQMELQVLEVTLVGIGARGWEDLIVFAPHN